MWRNDWALRVPVAITCVHQLPFEVRNEDLLGRYRQSPYIGRRLTGQVAQTILRGRIVCDISNP